MIEVPKKDLMVEDFPSDSSSNNMNMMNIPDDDEEVPHFGNPYNPNKKQDKKNSKKPAKEEIEVDQARQVS